MHSQTLITQFLAVSIVIGCLQISLAAESPQRWWKGNLHTHSLWSDGDDFPESIIEWYKDHGYSFLAISDHNILHKGERWVEIDETLQQAAQNYQKRFGPQWVVQRESGHTTEIRLRRLDEYRHLFEVPSSFLLIQSEEITDNFEKKPVHVNATNVKEYIAPQGGTSVFDVMQRNVRAVLEQQEKTEQPMFPHINHPNYQYAVTADDISRLEGERFFEIYNGHPLVHNEGDSVHESTEEMWDMILSFRLRSHGEILYGLAVDDAHHYHAMNTQRSNPGRGWVVIESDSLSSGSIIAAMQRGSFYASSGVALKSITFDGKRLSLSVAADSSAHYITKFIGTRKGKGLTVGIVLKVEEGEQASYEMDGTELYVRAVVQSDRRKVNPYRVGEFEKAWIQPVTRGFHR